MESDAVPVSVDNPFHLLILGDWSGRREGANFDNHGSESRLYEIDRDIFDDVLKSFELSVELDLDNDGQNTVILQINSLDDFHPDYIFEEVSVFSELRSLRTRLLKSDTYEEAAIEVRSWFEIQDEQGLSQNHISSQPEKNYSSPADILEDILSKPDKTGSSEVTQTGDYSGLSLLVSKLVKPFLINIDDDEQIGLISVVDEAISALMRKILHHPKFKELESAWRGLYFLVRGVETDSKLKVFIFDINKNELSSTLKASDNFNNSGLFHILENDKNWAIICGNYNFKINVDDIALLICIARISNSLYVPFVSYLDKIEVDNKPFTESDKYTNLISDNDAPEAKLWNAVRAIPETESIGLLIQRMLIRLPYGTATEPVEKFSFEELPDLSKQENYVWANPCFAFGLLAAQGYSNFGWKFENSFYQTIEGVPTFVFDDQGTSRIMSGFEMVMTEQLCEDILQLGFMPVLNYRNNDKIHLARVQSIALPQKNLRGRWS